MVPLHLDSSSIVPQYKSCIVQCCVVLCESRFARSVSVCSAAAFPRCHFNAAGRQQGAGTRAGPANRTPVRCLSDSAVGPGHVPFRPETERRRKKLKTPHSEGISEDYGHFLNLELID